MEEVPGSEPPAAERKLAGCLLFASWLRVARFCLQMREEVSRCGSNLDGKTLSGRLLLPQSSTVSFHSFVPESDGETNSKVSPVNYFLGEEKVLLMPLNQTVHPNIKQSSDGSEALGTEIHTHLVSEMRNDVCRVYQKLHLTKELRSEMNHRSLENGQNYVWYPLISL